MSTIVDSTERSPSPVVAGRYQLLEAIGAGGAGSVYRADDRVLGRPVAIKVFRAESVTPDDLVRQEREIRMLSTLSHPGLIAIYDAGRQNFDGSMRRFLVMELVSHQSLEQLLGRGAMTPHDVAAIGAQIADALDYLRSTGVVHRDVKPANILISDTGTSGFRRIAKLGDFGIAHYLDGNRLTSDGTILGTAAYLSPEQVSGRMVDSSSDIYSLGLVLLEALTGRPEFPGTVLESAIARTTRDPDLPDELPEEWARLLRAMTARQPGERPSAREVAAVLHGTPSPQFTGTGRRSERAGSVLSIGERRRRTGLLVGVGIALAVGASVLSFLLGYSIGQG
ncbi:MAG: serine/threonine protein kinase [Micrococcales bacterium]|nr:serine/threonine protein kinase [Micrococcales bacterium]